MREEKESWRVFGDYIDTYYYDKSIADGYTLKLMREPIETIYKERIESILDKLAGNVEVKKSDIDKNKIIEHESYLNALLDYIISDLRKYLIVIDLFSSQFSTLFHSFQSNGMPKQTYIHYQSFTFISSCSEMNTLSVFSCPQRYFIHLLKLQQAISLPRG